MTKTMKNSRGQECAVSEELYRLKTDITLNYEVGKVVRLIGGVEGRFSTPGHHFNPEYQTVTRIDSDIADHIGVKKDEIELI